MKKFYYFALVGVVLILSACQRKTTFDKVHYYSLHQDQKDDYRVMDASGLTPDKYLSHHAYSYEFRPNGDCYYYSAYSYGYNDADYSETLWKSSYYIKGKNLIIEPNKKYFDLTFEGDEDWQDSEITDAKFKRQDKEKYRVGYVVEGNKLINQDTYGDDDKSIYRKGFSDDNFKKPVSEASEDSLVMRPGQYYEQVLKAWNSND